MFLVTPSGFANFPHHALTGAMQTIPQTDAASFMLVRSDAVSRLGMITDARHKTQGIRFT